jgi:hypothetical protein
MLHAQAARLPSEAEPRERRRTPRMPMVFTLAKLTADNREIPCMVRNISDTGIQVQLPVPPVANSSVMVEMTGLAARLARVRWAKGRVAGLQFDTGCSIGDVFAARQSMSGSPHFRIERHATLSTGGGAIPVTVRQISTDELRLVARRTLETGCPCSIDLGFAGLSSRGVIGARVGGNHQFFFDKPWASVTLAQLLQDPGG